MIFSGFWSADLFLIVGLRWSSVSVCMFRLFEVEKFQIKLKVWRSMIAWQEFVPGLCSVCLTRVTRGTTRSCQNLKPLRDSHSSYRSSPGESGCTFCESPVLNPGHRPRCSTSCCAKIQMPEQRRAVFLDWTTWLQVVRSQNSRPPLLQDPPEKERPRLSNRAHIRNVGESRK